MLTKDELRAFAPHAQDTYLDALVDASAEQTKAGLTTPLRFAHFLAQCAHETGGFSIVRENTAWTAEQLCALWPSRFKTKLDPRILACRGDPEKLANLAYSGRADLGNVEADDGWAYRGGGFLQTTGRAAYHEAGAVLGLDLEGHPEFIEHPEVSLKAALYVWGKHNLNQFADRNYGRAIGNAINRGTPFAAAEPIGAAARAQWFERAWAMFYSHETLPSTDELALGAYGPNVRLVQSRLKDLGYPLGSVDGVFGPVLSRAVVAFKHDNDKRLGPALDGETGEIVGRQTMLALQNAPSIEHSPERTNATAADLAAKGSTEVAAGQQNGAAGQLMLYGGLLEAAQQLGLLDQLKALVAAVQALQTALVPLLDTLQATLQHGYPAVGIVAGVWVWNRSRGVISARVQAHQTGANLGR